MARNVVGLFAMPGNAEVAADRALALGHEESEISLLMTETTRGQAFGVKTHSKAAEGAGIGSAAGGVLGALAGSLVAVGGLAITGVGLVAVGPVVGFLSGLGAGAATGGIIGALVGLGIPESEAKLMEKDLEDGGVLVAVHTERDDVSQLKDIMKNAGAKRVYTRS